MEHLGLRLLLEEKKMVAVDKIIAEENPSLKRSKQM